MSDLRKLSLETFANGAAAEMFDKELQDVLANIDDVNTKGDARREITLKFVIEPDASRETASLSLEAKSKLAPIRDATGTAYFGKKNGKLTAYSHNIDQMELNIDEKPSIVREANV